MPATNSASAPASARTTPPGISLRPDLAAFYALATREFTPRRLAAEHGVLAELRLRQGYE